MSKSSQHYFDYIQILLPPSHNIGYKCNHTIISNHTKWIRQSPQSITSFEGIASSFIPGLQSTVIIHRILDDFLRNNIPSILPANTTNVVIQIKRFFNEARAIFATLLVLFIDFLKYLDHARP
eukprot:239738_1